MLKWPRSLQLRSLKARSNAFFGFLLLKIKAFLTESSHCNSRLWLSTVYHKVGLIHHTAKKEADSSWKRRRSCPAAAETVAQPAVANSQLKMHIKCWWHWRLYTGETVKYLRVTRSLLCVIAVAAQCLPWWSSKVSGWLWLIFKYICWAISFYCLMLQCQAKKKLLPFFLSLSDCKICKS